MTGGAISNPECVDKLKVLADGTRLAVVRILLNGPLRVSELIEALKLEPSLLSHHLRILRDSGLVTAKREGKAVEYALAAGVRGHADNASVDLGCCRIRFD